jgi:protein-S-isoprenylcysteine O-methyltransferase Ste14
VTEADFHRIAVYSELALGAATIVAVSFITAPYGRHTRKGFGPAIPQRLAWVLMEAPAVLVWGAIYLMGDHRAEAAPLAMLSLWMLHYVQRTFVFPFRIRSEGKTTPVFVVLSAVVFNLLNAYVNARWVSHFGVYASGWLSDPRFLIGAGMFLAGWALNIQADNVLLRLRAPGETGYKVPRGGLYELISCPNYFAEILEWCGWAILTWSLAGTSFAVYTIANLAPRAIAHHRWYKEKFSDYPANRRALVPFIL